MREILLNERARRPLARERDYLKLLYQSEFGGGHMISDPETSLARLRAECVANGAADESHAGSAAGAPREALANAEARAAWEPWARLAGVRAPEPVFEPVGGGLLRLNLRALPALGLRTETVNALFVHTANAARGSVAGLEAKLKTLADCAGELGLDAAALTRAVADWRAAGYPALSHSSAYRGAYAPAYRLVPEAAERYLPLFQRLDALLCGRGGARVALDGNSGAGKSTLGALLAEVYAANLYHMDDFFLPSARKTPARLAEPGGNVDWERFDAEILSRLGTPFSYCPWNCRTGAPGARVCSTPRPVEIVEGVYSLHPVLRDRYDLRVFLAVDAQTQVGRIRARSGEALLQRFVDEWIPLENLYFERTGARACCELVFEEHTPAL